MENKSLFNNLVIPKTDVYRDKTLPALIQVIHDKIQWLVDNDKLKNSSLESWERIYNDLVEIHTKNEAYITRLQEEHQAYFIRYQYLEEVITKLEAICLLHGITNINLYLARPTEMLVEEAKQAIEEGFTQLPGTLWTRISAADIQKLLDNK